MGENRKKVNAVLRIAAERAERAKTQSWKCPNCKTRIEGWWKYCAECGSHLAGPSYLDPPFACPPDEEGA
jgi:ribosomal protein L37AE/L43A